MLIDDVDRRAVFLSEGLGHAILSLEDNSTVMYLCSLEYTPALDRDINPLDPALGIDWPTTARDGTPLTYELSDKGRRRTVPVRRSARTACCPVLWPKIRRIGNLHLSHSMG